MSYISGSIDTHCRFLHKITRSTLYDDCIKMYTKTYPSIVSEYPFRISFNNEQAIDTGGVSTDFFSGFWESSYMHDFDSGNTYVPLNNPHYDIFHYKVLGTILLHGYMMCGHIPNRISFPVIAKTFLGCEVNIPNAILIDSFIDYLSEYESSQIQEAQYLISKADKNDALPPIIEQNLIQVLSRMGCHSIPTAKNLQSLLIDVAKYELITKPSGAIYNLHAGVPQQYYPFIATFSVASLYSIYTSSNVSQASVLKMITDDQDYLNANEERIHGYLKSLIGNLSNIDLRNFVRFVTGSSVLLNNKITVSFNSLGGLARRPIAHTCSYILELSTTY